LGDNNPSATRLQVAPLDPKQQQFIDSVLGERPRLAVFDCDGTLWSGDSGAGFFYWELERGLLSPELSQWASARYQEYLAGRVDEDTMCGEMVTIHEGLSCDLLAQLAEEFFSEQFKQNIFPEMLELVQRLHEEGCDLWAVSSTNDWVVTAGVRRFGISPEHVLAACVYSETGVASGRLRRVPSGPGKATAIRETIGRPVDAAFGNSVFDQDMLEIARHPYAINPSPELDRVAIDRGWRVYKPR